MGLPEQMKPNMPVTDVAYSILKRKGQATHFRELIREILEIKRLTDQNQGRVIAQIHTEINLDSRFEHHGNGEWGLRDWTVRRNGKVVELRPTSPARPAFRLGSRDEEDYSKDSDSEAENRLEDDDDGLYDDTEEEYGGEEE